MKKPLVIAMISAFALGGVAVAAFFTVTRADHRVAASSHPLWSEVQWPFPLDQWGRGRAFRCSADNCGAEVTILLRSKTGFCSCTTGIVDDDDLNRVSDAELFGDRLVPHDNGRAIRAGGLDGRGRAYAGAVASTPGQGILATAFHSNCDAIVATALAADDQLDRIEPAVMEFLNRRMVLRFALATPFR